MVHKALEHGGNLDHHIDVFGGEKSNWIDLSTGINNSPYPIPKIQDLLLKLEGFKWATTLDLNMAFTKGESALRL